MKLKLVFSIVAVGLLPVAGGLFTTTSRARHRTRPEARVDRIKDRAPIWKKEHYKDGSSRWINQP